MDAEDGDPELFLTLRVPSPLQKVDKVAHRFQGLPAVPTSGGRLKPFQDADVVTTLLVRPSDPANLLDVYACTINTRPNPMPDQHTWWCSAGGKAENNQEASCEVALDEPVSPLDIDPWAQFGTDKVKAPPPSTTVWSRLTAAMPHDHAGALYVGIFEKKLDGSVSKAGKVDIKASVSCPPVALPPMTVITGTVPRGQRRDFLWSLQSDRPLMEGQIYITRHLDDACHNDIIAGLGTKKSVKVERLEGKAQDVHAQPVAYISRQGPPSPMEHDWAGSKLDGKVHVAGHGCDGQVETSFTEEIRVCPGDKDYKVGRYRLALLAGPTEITFRVMCWNRVVTARDRALRIDRLEDTGPVSTSNERGLLVAKWRDRSKDGTASVIPERKASLGVKESLLLRGMGLVDKKEEADANDALSDVTEQANACTSSEDGSDGAVGKLVTSNNQAQDVREQREAKLPVRPQSARAPLSGHRNLVPARPGSGRPKSASAAGKATQPRRPGTAKLWMGDRKEVESPNKWKWQRRPRCRRPASARPRMETTGSETSSQALRRRRPVSAGPVTGALVLEQYRSVSSCSSASAQHRRSRVESMAKSRHSGARLHAKTRKGKPIPKGWGPKTKGRWLLATAGEAVQWGKHVEREVKEKQALLEGGLMLAVNGRERVFFQKLEPETDLAEVRLPDWQTKGYGWLTAKSPHHFLQHVAMDEKEPLLTVNGAEQVGRHGPLGLEKVRRAWEQQALLC
ncbi:unnamed protein product [Chrysoparadoxa australica]